MRLIFPDPGSVCDLGLDEALTTLAIPGLSGFSRWAGHVAFEFPDLEQAPDGAADKLEAILKNHSPSWAPVRGARGALLAEADWRIERAEDKGEDTATLRAYRQALRDVTKQADPRAVVWPVAPWEVH